LKQRDLQRSQTNENKIIALFVDKQIISHPLTKDDTEIGN